LPLFTNVVEGVFSEVCLITFSTKITHLEDVMRLSSMHQCLVGDISP
jgi:hypothetical protein